MELAARLMRHCTLGITGSNGKTTVTSLTAHILHTLEHVSGAYGNIGNSLFEVVEGPPRTCVVELSSFQLDSLYTPFLDAACLLNVAPNHLDRYASYEDYEASKWHMFDCLKPGGRAFVEQSLLAQAQEKGIAVQGFGFQPSLPYSSDGALVFENGHAVAELPPFWRGKRDFRLSNFLAAYSLCRTLDIPGERICQAATSFQPLPHRIQCLGTYAGVTFYNDSKATSVAAVITALETMAGPVILLAGGYPKGESFSPLLPFLEKKVKKVYAFGQAVPLLQKDLAAKIPFASAETMADAFSLSLELAKEGDSVLLSPGCASYDEFENYIKRGEAFIQLVQHTLLLTGERR
jgi:UDP-N-acetylmuramoylalanine--D-glutamate ligase